jgi:hypothetical protein
MRFIGSIEVDELMRLMKVDEVDEVDDLDEHSMLSSTGARDSPLDRSGSM